MWNKGRTDFGIPQQNQITDILISNELENLKYHHKRF